MKTLRLPVCEIANLLGWLALLILEEFGLGVDGLATVFLPISLIFLLIRQIKSTRPAFDFAIVFLMSCLFFFCVGILLWPFSNISLIDFSSLVVIKFTWKQLDEAAILIGLSIAITMATMMAFRHGNKHHEVQNTLASLGLNDPSAGRLYRLGMFCIVLSLPAVTFESIEQLRFIQDAGYLALYSDGISMSAMSKAFFYLFNLGFGLTLAFSRTRSEFLVPAFLFLIVATIDSSKGARGALLVPLLFITWFYVARFNIKVRPLKVMRNLAVLLAVFTAMTFSRDSDLLTSGIPQLAVDALATQGRSLQISALYLTVADEVAQYGNYTVFSNLLLPFTAVLHPEIREAAQSMDQVIYSNNLKHILTYVLNDAYYFAGGGTGGVYTIELIEAGAFFYVLLSMGLGWFLARVPSAMRKPWIRYLSVYLFSTVFYMPRAEFFPNVLIVGKALFLYLLIVGSYSIIKNRDNSNTTCHKGTLVGSGTE